MYEIKILADEQTRALYQAFQNEPEIRRKGLSYEGSVLAPYKETLMSYV